MRLAKEMMNEKRWADFEEQRDADFSYEIPGVGRFRVNAHYQRNTVALAIPYDQRQGPPDRAAVPARDRQQADVPAARADPRDRRRPARASPRRWPAMIDAINKREQGHIITLEDPIEYAFVSNKCAIEQREVGADVPTLRQRPAARRCVRTPT